MHTRVTAVLPACMLAAPCFITDYHTNKTYQHEVKEANGRAAHLEADRNKHLKLPAYKHSMLSCLG